MPQQSEQSFTLVITDRKHLLSVLSKAEQAGGQPLVNQLTNRLLTLVHAAPDGGCVIVTPDGDRDFSVLVYTSHDLVTRKFIFNGGLIYQGPNHPADGSAPSFTVSLHQGTGWFLHT